MFGHHHKRTQPSRETARAIHPAGSGHGSPADILERMALRLAVIGLARFDECSSCYGGELAEVWSYFDQAPAAVDASARGL